MAREIISRAEAARRCGVTPAAITKQCKPGGALVAAMVGKRIDATCAAFKAYAKGRTPHPTKVAAKAAKAAAAPTAARRKAPAKPAAKPAPAKPATAGAKARPRPGAPANKTKRDVDVTVDDIDALADKSLRELTEIFGTAPMFKDWLDARKKIADTHEKDLKNAETTGRVIQREFVSTHMFGVLDAMTRRILGDSPKTIARRLYSMARSGEPIEDAEKLVRDNLSSQIKPAKAEITRNLRR